jgi:hypothetical protein
MHRRHNSIHPTYQNKAVSRISCVNSMASYIALLPTSPTAGSSDCCVLSRSGALGCLAHTQNSNPWTIPPPPRGVQWLCCSTWPPMTVRKAQTPMDERRACDRQTRGRGDLVITVMFKRFKNRQRRPSLFTGRPRSHALISCRRHVFTLCFSLSPRIVCSRRVSNEASAAALDPDPILCFRGNHGH